MRKIYHSLLALVALTFAACESHDDLWQYFDDLNTRVKTLEEKSEEINANIEALRLLVNAGTQGKYILSVDNTSAGYRIVMSDGTEMHIYHGADGKNGADGTDGTDGAPAPAISLKEYSDGNYYWTVDGQWLTVDGKMVRANGTDGTDGASGNDGTNGSDGKDGIPGITPKIRINSDTLEWEISTDNGSTWEGTGVKATVQGDQGGAGSENSLFASVQVCDDYVEFTLSNGTTFKVPTYMTIFRVTDDDGNDLSEAESPVSFGAGEEATFNVTANNIVKYQIEQPRGWSVTYNEDAGTLKIASPVTVTGTQNDASGKVTFTLQVNTQSRAIEMVQTAVYSFKVAMTSELRILTFEDDDARFDEYALERGSQEFNIKKWSDLIDSKQYGGDLLYDGMNYMGDGKPYWWYDENNTFLKHTMVESYGTYIFWNGGHVISNYASNDIESTGDHTHQLTISGTQGSAGHNGSANFAMHNGYIDDSGFSFSSILPSFEFGDGKERIIDHMWVMPNNYALNCYVNGNSLTSRLGPNDYVKITAEGFSSSGVSVGSTEIILANGDNIVKEWTKWNLSSLGKVAKVEFNILGSSDNGYGFSQPAYFAYDDVAVVFDIEE